MSFFTILQTGAKNITFGRQKRCAGIVTIQFNPVAFRDKKEQKANKKRSLGENSSPSDILTSAVLERTVRERLNGRISITQ